MKRIIIGVMGPAHAPEPHDLKIASDLGRLIAVNGWVLLTGGRQAGVMHAASEGASESGGLTVGILPGNDTSEASPHIAIPIVTGMGSARNNINVLSSDIVIACGTGTGTSSEVLLSLKAGKHVILLNQQPKAVAFFQSLNSNCLHPAHSPRDAIDLVKTLLDA